MTTPIERAAKTSRKALNTAYRLDCTDEADVYQAVANAALSAIAEPSEAMIDAMRALTIYDSTKAEVTALWKAAHAALMAEKDTGE